MDHEAPNHPMTSVLKGLIAVGVCLGAILTGLGWLAHWWPALDLVNNGLPATAAGAVLLVCLGAITRDWRLIVASALLATINVALVVSALQGAAADAAPGSERFLRIATFNLWAGNERMDNVAKFLGDTDADAVVLQEMTTEHWSTLHQALGSRYPYSLGEAGLVILSKHPILAEGRIDRPGYPPWMSLMLRWARIEVNGTTFELVGSSRAALLSRARGRGHRGGDAIRASPDAASHRCRGFQHEPLDGEAGALHGSDGAQAL